MAPFGTDWIGYQTIISYLKKHGTLKVEGDLLEIGTFLGGGALKLSQTLQKYAPDKKLYVIDVFDPCFDWTQNSDGKSMANLYQKALRRYNGRSQLDIYSEVTANRTNIQTIKADSKNAKLPTGKLCFALIDGNHSPEYVESDFYLVWKRLQPKGVLTFHDYEGDLPQTTQRIKLLMERHKNEIQVVHQERSKWLVFITKSSNIKAFTSL